jgi:ubiquitin carboxyl-terminal hydrolase 22/27/51
VHCKPLQRYFLNDIGHHHESCQLYRHKDATKKKKKKNGDSAKIDSVCLACEMDRLFLAYYGSTIGKDVLAAIDEACHPNDDDEGNDEIKVEKGDPLTISEMLTASWKSGGMNNLAGYEQHDAHEFLNSFLDLMGKHSRQHRDRVYSAINTVRDDNAMVPKTDKTQNGM